MATCKGCGKEFHACGSCDLQEAWEWEYCGWACKDQKFEELIDQASVKFNLPVAATRELLDLFIDARVF